MRRGSSTPRGGTTRRRPSTGRRRLTKLLVLALSALFFAPLTAGRASASVPLDELAVTTTQLAQGLQRPTGITAPDDGTGRLFILEKAGDVRVYDPEDGLLPDPLLDIKDKVDESDNERGLLGIVPAPDFARSQVLYLAYTALPDGADTLARYSLKDDSLEVLLSQDHHENTNHNAGQLAFGPDGDLYWSLGDGGSADDPPNNAQNLNTLLGKILRIDVSRACGDLPYCVPDDNPFVGVANARPEIWVYGVRNPWRFSFDDDGSLWIGDVGQGSQEEVDHLTPDQGGANLGWSCREGTGSHLPDRCDDGTEFTEPVFTYRTSNQGCSVIGGYVYHGAEFGDLADGTYLASDYCSSTAWAIRQNADGSYTTGTLGTLPTQVTAFGEGADGELYMVNDLPGQLHRINFERTATTR
ncbi:sorbosone dehydrogenase family protein [Streptomyces sp. TS71-3]|uniref:PQQ-dependent sugar dehydrogenase n=1 Tax=Streptomyces sp. TS71-3 TaxID=2733862 RepID=UPI001B1E14C7|nr:PQQ-dependent sugar dehydrogenase [Streptomyces sp. TS71-3]GHJ40108.1 glucose dehydrogenase [Streptomyces sp. TS71-3]